jgi:uncharacterized membrane protein
MTEPPNDPAPTGGFQVNGPTVVALLYLATYFTVFSALVGVILAYVWRREEVPEWQRSQFTYLVRTFWMGVGGYALFGAVGLAAILAFETDAGTMPDWVQAVGLVVCGGGLLALTVLLLVRCAFVIVNAQQRVPMRNARSWWV